MLIFSSKVSLVIASLPYVGGLFRVGCDRRPGFRHEAVGGMRGTGFGTWWGVPSTMQSCIDEAAGGVRNDVFVF